LETTAAATGEVGVLRRDPMAMLPFCGYNLADYFGHWLRLGAQIPRPPKIFFINWFRRDEKGKFLWPGFGENIRALKWIIGRTAAAGSQGARETPVGFIPGKGSLDLAGLRMPEETLAELCSVNLEEWKEELADARNFLNRFGNRMPKGIWEEFRELEKAVSQP